MTPTVQAFARFEAAYVELLQAAARLREQLATEAGLKCDQPCELIVDIVARFYGLTPERMLSRERTREVATARHVAMWLCRNLTTHTLVAIGDTFHRDHGTVIAAVNTIADRVVTESRFASDVLDLRHRCEEALRTS